MLASGEHLSMESIMRANTDRSLCRSAESMSYNRKEVSNNNAITENSLDDYYNCSI